MQSLMKEKVSLLELWEERKGQFEQCMELQLFLRDAFQADNWMAKQEVREGSIMAVNVIGHGVWDSGKKFILPHVHATDEQASWGSFIEVVMLKLAVPPLHHKPKL